MRLLMGMQLVTVGCGPAASPNGVVPTTEEPAARAVPSAELAAREATPWQVVRTRRCSSWDLPTLVATQHELFSCTGTTHDPHSGALLAVDAQLHHRRWLAGDETRSLWALDSELRDTTLLELRTETVRTFTVPGWVRHAGLRGTHAVLATEREVLDLDLARGTVEPRNDVGCAGAQNVDAIDTISIDDGGNVRCLVRRDQVLFLVSADAELQLPELLDAVIDLRADGSHRVLGTLNDSLVAVGPDGQVTTLASGRNPALLAVDREGALLVSIDDRTDRIDASGAREVVLPERGQQGAFLEGSIVVISDGLIHWVAPTPVPATSERPSPSRELPTWLAAAARVSSGFSVPWTDYVRRADEVLAWASERPRALVTLAYLDRSELTAFEGDDATWGRTLLGRFVDRAGDRWGRVFHQDGHRLFRGHAWIDGCERTHIDVLIVELESVLELWTATTTERSTAARIFGRIPSRAVLVEDVWESEYVGDTSIGAVDR